MSLKELLDEIQADAEVLIAGCQTEAELANVQALLLGKDSYIKQMERALWAKPREAA